MSWDGFLYIHLVLAHWNNSQWVDIYFYSDTLFWFRKHQSLLIFIFFSLTRSRLEPRVYCTQGEHANHYTTDTVYNTWTYLCYIIVSLQLCNTQLYAIFYMILFPLGNSKGLLVHLSFMIGWNLKKISKIMF